MGVSASLSPTEVMLRLQLKKLEKILKVIKLTFLKRPLHNFVENLKNKKIVPDILINNAGTIRRNSAENHPTEWWDEVIEVNLSSQFLLSREIGREMINRGSEKLSL